MCNLILCTFWQSHNYLLNTAKETSVLTKFLASNWNIRWYEFCLLFIVFYFYPNWGPLIYFSSYGYVTSISPCFCGCIFPLGCNVGTGSQKPLHWGGPHERSRQENAKRSGMYNFLFCSVKLSAHFAACSR